MKLYVIGLCLCYVGTAWSLKEAEKNSLEAINNFATEYEKGLTTQDLPGLMDTIKETLPDIFSTMKDEYNQLSPEKKTEFVVSYRQQRDNYTKQFDLHKFPTVTQLLKSLLYDHQAAIAELLKSGELKKVGALNRSTGEKFDPDIARVMAKKLIDLAFQAQETALTEFTKSYRADDYLHALSALVVIQEAWHKIVTATITLYKTADDIAKNTLYKAIVEEWNTASTAASQAEKLPDADFWQASIKRFIHNLRYETLQALSKGENLATDELVELFFGRLHANIQEKITQPFMSTYQAIVTTQDKSAAVQAARVELQKALTTAQALAPLLWKKDDKNKTMLQEIATRKKDIAKRMDENRFMAESFWLDIEAAYRGERFAQDLASIEKKYIDLIDAKMIAPTEHISPADQETNSLLVKFANTLATIRR